MKLHTMLTGLALAIATPGIANAQEGWAQERKVVSLYPHANGFTFVLSGARVNVGSPCEDNRMILPLSAQNYDAIVSSIMTAFTSGYVIDAAYDTSSITSCDTVVNRVVVYRRG
ncbi:hypothetical protein Q9Q95_05305 [Sphingomonas sp. DG1-23]|uniref:hypothetical protein n=1 Tax=Sphingomonas sp. DG1-23 TaxID=3068316 RepID=UPI00273E8E89|nr:hypothetical protein [Sphingomonas sp. DG1-23]MDP5278335.1 hypothetical protein [Sphingomonas sp. DG1-23]